MKDGMRLDTIKINNGKTRMVAHRGVSGLEKENSMLAFTAAGNRSFWGIESDVHKTADGKYVMIHDDNTGRVSDTDICIEESTFDEISKIRLLDIDGETKRRDLIVPTLDEYINICKKYEKIAVLEYKNRFKKEDIIETLGIINNLGYLEKTVFISFNFDNLVDLRVLAPKNEIQFLTKEYTPDLIGKLKEYSLGLDISYKALTEDIINEIKRSGITLNCWTVNDKEHGEWLADSGVDYITTNILE